MQASNGGSVASRTRGFIAGGDESNNNDKCNLLQFQQQEMQQILVI